jgi:hypothetical protein
MGDRVSEGSGLIDLVGDLVAALIPPHPNVLITCMLWELVLVVSLLPPPSVQLPLEYVPEKTHEETVNFAGDSVP